MEKDNLRNRKRHSFDFMRTRLVLLDFVLANQNLTYFETEQGKVNFFCNELGLSKEFLPGAVYEGASPDQKTIRYFVEKFPLFVAPPLPGHPPVVTFSYVDSGFERPSSFASHLVAYRPLFRQLNSFRFLYVAAKQVYFQGAEERFRTIVKRQLEADVSKELLRYFQVRKRWDNHEYIIPVTEDLEFLRYARQHFQKEEFERLYRCWRSGELSECELRAQLSQQQPAGAIFFETFLVTGHCSSHTGNVGQGDRYVKVTNHPSVHRFVHRQ